MKIQKIEIIFPIAVELPKGFLTKLDALVDTACEKYESEHPTRVMWPAMHGAKMLSNPYTLEDDEPMKFDDRIYQIIVDERQDFYGTNPLNPNRDHWRCPFCGELNLNTGNPCYHCGEPSPL